MNIHDRIKQFQNERNWTINHMALEAELSPATVINWFKRKATPTFEGIESLCRAFGITISQFFNYGDQQPTYLSESEAELQKEWNLLHKDEKEDLLKLVKTINRKRTNSNPL